MRAELNIKGFDEMRALLKKLPENVERRFIHASARKAMEPVKVAAQANLVANRSLITGATRESISIKSKKMRDGTLSTRVGPNSKVSVLLSDGRTHRPAAISHLLERGTKHADAKPFMEPAWDAEKDGAWATYKTELWKRVKRWVEANRRV